MLDLGLGCRGTWGGLGYFDRVQVFLKGFVDGLVTWVGLGGFVRLYDWAGCFTGCWFGYFFLCFVFGGAFVLYF